MITLSVYDNPSFVRKQIQFAPSSTYSSYYLLIPLVLLFLETNCYFSKLETNPPRVFAYVCSAYALLNDSTNTHFFSSSLNQSTNQLCLYLDSYLRFMLQIPVVISAIVIAASVDLVILLVVSPGASISNLVILLHITFSSGTPVSQQPRYLSSCYFLFLSARITLPLHMFPRILLAIILKLRWYVTI
jgi:hypothetical protein